jgi:tetratricopeptide (TPR) repeat protein
MVEVVRAGIGGLAAGRPALGLPGPVVRFRLDEVDGVPIAYAETADTGAGRARAAIRCLPGEADRRSLDALLDLAPVLALPADRSDAQNELAAGLRSLARHARTSGSAEDFTAAVLRAGQRTPAARLLADLQGVGSTAERRRTLHVRLRAVRVPRPAELPELLGVWPADAIAAVRAARMVEDALRSRTVDLAAAGADEETAGTSTPRSTGWVFAVPGRGNPAEEVTRSTYLADAARVLADRSRPRRLALVGLSGMGKSALAVRLCRQLGQAYRVVGWLSAADVGAWQSSVALLADRLGAPGADPDQLWDVLAEHRPALVVVDDAPEPSMVADTLPLRPGIHVLVTSQSPRWRAEAEVLELEPLELPEATEFLLRRTGADDEELAGQIARRLDGLPLALEQAAAAVVDGLSLRGWLDRYDAQPSAGVSALRQAWQVRMTGLRTAYPDALTLLRIIACAGAGPVPGELLAAIGADLDHPAVVVCRETGRRDSALAELRRQSLVRTGADEETVSVHPLLAEVIRADPDFQPAVVAELVAAAAGRLLEESDVDDAPHWSRTAALVGVAVAACRLVLAAADQYPRDRAMALANHALWLPAAYLHERGAALQAYQVRLLGLALHGDGAAAAAVRGWSDATSDTFGDLAAEDVLPAGRLGEVGRGEPRMSAARWLNENAELLTEVDLDLAESYARRALDILPRQVAAAQPSQPVPWPARIRIEILDNLAFIMVLRGDYREAIQTLDRALRLQRSFPDFEVVPKYGELVNDRALVLLDNGLPLLASRDFTRALAVPHPDPNVAENIQANLARADHELGRLTLAHGRLQVGLERLWQRSHPQDSALLIQQCNTGLAAYDLGDTEDGYALVYGSWLTIEDRLGARDRETVIRRLALARLQLARGDVAAALRGLELAVEVELAMNGEGSSWLAVWRAQAAWLAGPDLLASDVAERMTADLLRAFGSRGRYAAAALDLLTAATLAAAQPAQQRSVERARRAVELHGAAVGPHHAETLLGRARLALVGTGRRKRLAAGTARALLTTPDSLTAPGWDGFAADLARRGQPPPAADRPGWEADRLTRLLDRDVLDLDPGEQLCWRANAGRFAALAGAADAPTLLRDAARGSAVLYGPHHPWTRLREANAAVAAEDLDALREVAVVPCWT